MDKSEIRTGDAVEVRVCGCPCGIVIKAPLAAEALVDILLTSPEIMQGVTIHVQREFVFRSTVRS